MLGCTTAGSIDPAIRAIPLKGTTAGTIPFTAGDEVKNFDNEQRPFPVDHRKDKGG